MEKQHPQSVRGTEEYRKILPASPSSDLTMSITSTFHQQLPLVTTDPRKLEDQAKSVLKTTEYSYVAGGAGERAAMDANRLAFRQRKLVPRMLQPTTHRDLTIELFSEKYESPVLTAPVGVLPIFHEDAETGLSEVCSEIGVPYVLSTAPSCSIEEVAKVNGKGSRWFQLYWPQDDDITMSLLKRAEENGYKLMNLDGAYIPFMKGVGKKTGFTDPIKLLKKHWDGSIVLEGIQHPEDAKLAVAAYQGRQLDGAVRSLEMLPEIVEAVGDKLTVIFDSGIRTGVDIIKALSFGARVVFVGRPAIHDLAVAEKQGAKQVLQGILADVNQSMGLAGIVDIEGRNRSMIRRVQYGGDLKSSD
ncbi:FMN-dependent dehydrogenase [Acephala macrosclerotiorum]|nr:FMN-dependent dehydrogenase [Acephala macrosclerotiorum]